MKSANESNESRTSVPIQDDRFSIASIKSLENESSIDGDKKRTNFYVLKQLSIIYAILIIILGILISIGDINEPNNDRDHLYNILTTVIGIIFLIYLHFDIQKHKRLALEWQELRQFTTQSDSISVTTAIIFNRMENLKYSTNECNDKIKNSLNSYRFIEGKSSGTFYLKIGMIRKR